MGLSACGKRNKFLWFDEPEDVDCEKCLVSLRVIRIKRRPTLEEVLEEERPPGRQPGEPRPTGQLTGGQGY